MKDMKSALKNMAICAAIRPIQVAQWLFRACGLSYFFQGDILDALLEHRTVVALADGKRLVFHTPNAIAKFRADTLMTKEPDTIEWIDSFEPHAVFWDVGANVGLYSLYAAARHRELAVFAVEPSIENIYLLNRNISTNGFSARITALPFALSDKTKPALLRHAKLQLGGACNSFDVEYSFDGKPQETRHSYQVLGFAADDLEEILGVPRPNYLKVDVDGIEHLIAMGARRILSDPALKSVLIELNDDFAEQRNRTVEVMAECGLVLRGQARRSDLPRPPEFQSTQNHLFVRPEQLQLG